MLHLIVNEAALLVGASAAFMRLLEGEVLVARAATESAAGYLADNARTRPALPVGEWLSPTSHVMATKEPLVILDIAEDVVVLPETRLMAQNHGFHGAALVPLLADDRSLGVLAVLDKNIRSFSDDEVSLLSAFADQAALALEKARLFNEAEREKERSDALYRISNKLAAANDTDQVLDLIVNEAVRLVATTAAFIRLVEGDVLVPGAATQAAHTFASRSAEERPTVEIGEGVSAGGQVIATKKPLIIEDMEQNELLSPSSRTTAVELGFHGLAGVPLLVGDRAIGYLAVMDTNIRRFTDEEVSLLEAFADQAALALEKARLLNEAETEKDRAETERERADSLYRVSNLLAGAHDTDEVLQLIVNEAARLVSAPFVIVRLLEGGVLVPRAATEPASGYAAETKNLNVEEGTSGAGHTMARKEPIFGDEIIYPHNTRQHLLKYGFYGTAVFPLLANNRSIGTLSVADWRVRSLTDDEAAILSAFADQASLALEKARFLQESELRERQATQLYEVTTQLASNHDLDSVLDLITQQAVELTGGGGGTIFKYDDSREALVAATLHNLGPEFWDMLVRPGEGNSGRAFVERRAIWTNDLIGNSSVLYSDADTDKIIKNLGSEWGLIGVVAAPIIIQDEVYFVLNVIFDKHRDFTDEEVNLVQNLADTAAVAINNARFIKETQQARDEATQLYEITQQLASSKNMESVLDLIVTKATELLGSDATAIWRMDQSKDALVVARGYNVPSDWAENVSSNLEKGRQAGHSKRVDLLGAWMFSPTQM